MYELNETDKKALFRANGELRQSKAAYDYVRKHPHSNTHSFLCGVYILISIVADAVCGGGYHLYYHDDMPEGIQEKEDVCCIVADIICNY